MSVGHSTVDERIVEMRIDNEKFEAGAKKTIGILESLDRSLKGLGQDNADGFDNIEKSLDKVTDRFSAMGIVGDQVMRNLTNKAIEMVGQFKNMATMLTTQQIDAGWNKYADKTQAIQTIMAATSGKIDEGFFANQAEQMSWVNEQIEKLNKFTDETSYNFLDMVGNIGKFTAAGRELEESVTAMEGIANWAAISGGRPAEAGRAMYNLSQALGMGAVTTIDWKSIENANMATYEFKQQAIDAAVEMGTLKKVADGVWETMEGGFEVTVENFRNSLSFGKGTDAIHWFNSDVLLSVLNRYGEFSDKLLEAVDSTDLTVTNYLKLIKAYKDGDAAFQKQIEDLSLTQKEVRAILPDLERLSAVEYDLGFRAFQAAQEAKTFTEAIDATKDAVSTKWMTVFELLFGNYLEAKELWTKMAEVFWDIFAKPVDHLIDIIENAQGFLGMDGWVSGFSGEMEQAAGGTAVLEDRLHAVGKDMKDFHKALETVIGGEAFHRLIQDYHDVDNALLQGAISADTFKKALGVLDDTFDSKKPVTLNRALNKAGKTMAEFEKALKDAMDPKDVVNVLGSYESIEDAFRNGAISVEDFKKALASLGIDSENVTEDIEQTVATGVGDITKMRDLALEVLRGDHGSGEERMAWYKMMGLDPELMQAMVGDLKNLPRAVLDDDYLMEIMESYYRYNNLAARLGYETFAEYLASISGSTEEYVYDMNSMANEADNIYASLFGSGVLDDVGELHSAGELFRTSLTNLLDALDEFGKAFDKAFLKVFGGSEDYDESILNMSDGFFTLTAAFYSFSESVLKFSKSDAFLNFATAMFSILRLIGKTISFVFKIGKIGLSVILKLLSPVLKLATTIFNAISTGLDTVGRAFESSGIINFIDDISDNLLKKISGPIDKINNAIDQLVKAFKDGFSNGGGIAGGLRKMSAVLDQLFEDHPVFLTVIHAIGRAIIFLKDAAAGAALVLGSVFGGAIALVVAVFQQLGSWISQFVNWAKSSELVTDIWNGLTSALKKFGEVVERVYEYAKQGYQENGFMGALSAIAASFERGVKRLIPGGEKLLEIFNSVKNAFTGLFKRKVVDENGVETVVDETNDGLLKLGESIEKYGNISEIIRAGLSDNESQKAGVRAFVGNLWEGFLEGLRDIRISDVISALRLGVIANVLLKVGHGLNIFNNLADNISDIPDRLNNMFEDLGQTFRSLSFSINANAVMKFAGAAALIAGAIFLLSKIPDDKIEKASSVMLAILTVLALFGSAIAKTTAPIFASLKFLPVLGTGLIGFAAAVTSIGLAALTISLAAKYIGVGPLREASKTIMSILGVMAVMLAGIIVLIKGSAFNSFQIKAIGSMFMRMGAGMMVMALAVQMLVAPILVFCAVLKFARSGMGLGKFALAVGAVLGILITFGFLVSMMVKSLKGVKKDKQIAQIGNFLIKAAASLMVVALAMHMFVAPIILLAAAQKAFKLDINGVIGSMAILGLIASVILLILAAFGGEMAKKHYKQIQAVGTMLIKMGASMLLIALGVRLLMTPIIKIAELCERMDDRQILKSLAVLVGMLVVLAGLLAVLNTIVLKGKGGSNSLGLGKGLFRIAEAIFLLAAAALVLTPAIILMTAAISQFTYILGNMDDRTWAIFEKGLTRLGKFAGPLFKFGGALLIVGLAATLTGTGIIAMAAGILVFAGAIAIIMLAMPKIVDVFERLQKLDPKSLAVGIGKVMLILGAFMIVLIMVMSTINRIYSLLGGGIFKNVGKNFLKTIQNIVTGMRNGVSNGFTKVIEFLKDEDNRKALLAVLETMIVVGASYVAGLLPTFAHVIIGGIVELLNAVADEIKKQAPDIVEALRNVLEAAILIVAGLFDSVLGTNMMTKLSESEEALDKVTTNVERVGLVIGGLSLVGPFKELITKLTGVGGVTSAMDNVQTVASMTDEIMEGLSGSSEGYFSVLLSSLSTVLLVTGLTAIAIGSIYDAFRDLAQQAKDESEQMNIELFGKEDASIEERADALDEISEKYDKLVDQEEELNNNKLEALKTGDVEAYNKALDDYLDGAEDRISYINDVEVAAEQLAQDMADALLPDAGMFKRTELARDILFKIKDADYDLSKVEEYQQYLDLVAQSETKLADVTRDVTAANDDFVSGIKNAKDAMTMLKSIDISEYGYSMEQISRMGDVELVNLARAIEQGLGQAWSNTEETAQTTSEQTKASIQEETDLVNEETNAVNDLFNTLKDVFGSGGRLVNRDQMKQMFGFFGDTSWMDSLSDTDLKAVGSEIINGLTEGVDSKEAKDKLESTLAQYGVIIPEPLKKALGIASPSTVMRDEVGQYIPAGIGVGIEQNYYQAVNPIYKLLDEMLDAFTYVRTRLAESGTQIITGIVDGIASNIQYAYDAGRDLAASFDNGFRERLDIHSPSGVMYDNAYNTVLGTVNGYNDAVKANLLGTNSMSDSLAEVLYDKSKKLLLPFKVLTFGYNVQLKKTRKEIFDGLNDDFEGYLTALARLAQKKEDLDQQISDTPEYRDDEIDRLHVVASQYDTLTNLLYTEFANALGLTTEAWYKQLDAAHGNIYEMQIMREILGDVSAESENLKNVDVTMPLDEASSSANDLYTNTLTPFEQIDQVFNTYGADAAYGLVRGILENLYQAYQSGSDLAIALENGFTEALQIQSPSRVFAQLAQYIPLGIKEGIGSESDSAISSIVILGDELVNAIMQSMAMVSTIADEDFELAPRIVPVVDMTNVDSAADSMSGLFGNNNAMSAQMSSAISRRMADVERLAANMGNSQTINNGDNITFNIYGAEGQDPNEIADAVMLRMQNLAVRRGAAFG